MLLQDKIAFIIGAADGVGADIARVFALEGASIAAAEPEPMAAERAARMIDPTGKRALGVTMELTNEKQVEAAVQKAIETFGGIDILVTYGGPQILGSLVDFQYADWQRLLSIHLDGAFLATRAALRQMYCQRSGCIIYLGSIYAKEGSLHTAPYTVAKHGLVGLSKVVAAEGAAHGVRANVICPGHLCPPFSDSEISQRARILGLPETEVIEKFMLSRTADGEFTTLEDVSETALFLATFGSNALSGQSIVVSHGTRME